MQPRAPDVKSQATLLRLSGLDLERALQELSVQQQRRHQSTDVSRVGHHHPKEEGIEETAAEGEVLLRLARVSVGWAGVHRLGGKD